MRLPLAVLGLALTAVSLWARQNNDNPLPITEGMTSNDSDYISQQQDVPIFNDEHIRYLQEQGILNTNEIQQSQENIHEIEKPSRLTQWSDE